MPKSLEMEAQYLHQLGISIVKAKIVFMRCTYFGRSNDAKKLLRIVQGLTMVTSVAIGTEKLLLSAESLQTVFE